MARPAWPFPSRRREGPDPNRTHFIYYSGALRLPETAAPNTKNRSHSIEIQIERPGDGVLLAIGGQSVGFVLYVKDGTPIYHYNWLDRERTVIRSGQPLPEGSSSLCFKFHYDGGGVGQGGEGDLSLIGQEVGRQRIPHTVAGRFGIDTFGVGADTGSPLCNDYRPPYSYTGRIRQVDIRLDAGDGSSTAEEDALQARFKAGKDY
ncbi:hypothetical protein VB734_11715 [Synechococcus sp. BA-124 BA4]|uniref:hypothetical protein n=1 Tax=unclassified Synechococcus TaxID=2626047 RepID=UPI001938F5E1|nr:MULTISPECIES: hypothetical protein [unclassified Synechococcus]MEA5400704.1 hypothetical protein [Synechococcus sp. BA-124 BA4]QPN58440.1 hypothetical protein I1E95_06950 [Synechococcus sp. CBW1107]